MLTVCLFTRGAPFTTVRFSSPATPGCNSRPSAAPPAPPPAPGTTRSHKHASRHPLTHHCRHHAAGPVHCAAHPALQVQLYWSSRLKKSDFSDQFANYFSFGFQFANISMLYLSNRYQNSLPLESRILYVAPVHTHAHAHACTPLAPQLLPPCAATPLSGWVLVFTHGGLFWCRLRRPPLARVITHAGLPIVLLTVLRHVSRHKRTRAYLASTGTR